MPGAHLTAKPVIRKGLDVRSLILVTTTLLVGMVPAFADILPIGDAGVLVISNATGTVLGLTTSPTLCLNFGGGTTCAGATHPMTVSGTSSIFALGGGTIEDVSTTPITAFETVPGAGLEAGKTIDFDLASFVRERRGGYRQLRQQRGQQFVHSRRFGVHPVRGLDRNRA